MEGWFWQLRRVASAAAAAMEVALMHLEPARAPRYLGAEVAGEGLAHILVYVPYVGAQGVLPREGLVAEIAGQP